MSGLFVYYPNCGTCRKALKWLEENDVQIEKRNIVENSPTRAELEKWHAASGLPIRKLFNTSGKKYRELDLKRTVRSTPDAELLSILAADGMLVKRPIMVTEEGRTLFGFNETEWSSLLKDSENYTG
jgi:arsenate reductase (glutaredoxin)